MILIMTQIDQARMLFAYHAQFGKVLILLTHGVGRIDSHFLLPFIKQLHRLGNIANLITVEPTVTSSIIPTSTFSSSTFSIVV